MPEQMIKFEHVTQDGRVVQNDAQVAVAYGSQEPTFILSANDPFALSALGEWLRQSYIQHGSETMRSYVESIMEAFVKWRENVTEREVAPVETS